MCRDKSAPGFELKTLLGREPTFTKILSTGVVALGLGVASLGACAQGQANQASPSIEGRGKHFYDTVCAKCHEAGIGPVIKGRGFDPGVYTTIVRYGLRAMPAFRVTDIDDATLQDLASYLSKTPVQPQRKVQP